MYFVSHWLSLSKFKKTNEHQTIFRFDLFKTVSQAGINESQNMLVAKKFIQEAIDENFKLIMIRSDMVS
jgi:hypothetical protein